MKRKWRETAGLTLVEMLCAVAILILLGLLLNTGLQMAVKSYRNITAASETQLLLSTAVDALTDELRYAQDAVQAGETAVFTSGSFGAGTSFVCSGEGQLVTNNGRRLLPPGAYRRGAYEIVAPDGNVSAPSIFYDKDSWTFTIRLKVQETGGGIFAETPAAGVTVRCLNPPKAETAAPAAPGEGGGTP